MRNIISVDVEEYFHAANLSAVAGPSQWRRLPSRVEHSTAAVLELFEQHRVKGTFFVLGYCAKRYPQMVRAIADSGHEVASHGYGHRIAYEQSASQFYRDVRIAKGLLEDLTGTAVVGYRAPNFSITPKNPWAYEELVRAGYTYDSSRYPIWHPRYANQNSSLHPETVHLATGSLMVYPLAVASCQIFSYEARLPVAGGAYWRLLPLPYLSWGLRRVNNSGRMAVTYFHPWEMDPGQPVFKELPLRTRLRHYGNTSSFRERLSYFLTRFEFTNFRDIRAQQ